MSAVFEEAEIDITKEISNRKLSYFGHMLQKDGNCLEKKITKTQRRKGRPRTYWKTILQSTWTYMYFKVDRCI